MGVFDWGIASGDPTTSGVILWTRVNPANWTAATTLSWQVATDSGFSTVVASGSQSSANFSSSRDYCVRVDVTGLSAGTRYYYRLNYASTYTPTGRCRTLPATASTPAQVKLAMLTCNHFEEGYFSSLSTLAVDDSVDFVVHFGDFIYEYVGLNPPLSGRTLTLPSAGTYATTLADYRYLYATYRTDTHLQTLLKNHTFIFMIDDHEVANDFYWDNSNSRIDSPDHPYKNTSNMNTLYYNALKAWVEWTPSRELISAGYTSPQNYLLLYRAFQFGTLLTLNCLNTRTFRSPHPCGETGDERVYSSGCAQQSSSSQTMLGSTQLAWLQTQLSSSTTTWQAIASPGLMTELAAPPADSNKWYLKLDGWDGYQYERGLIAESCAGTRAVVLSGDIHATVVGYVKTNYTAGTVTTVELTTPALSSRTLGAELLEGSFGGMNEANHAGIFRNNNAHLVAMDGYQNGYGVVTFGGQGVRYEVFECDRTDSAGTPTLSDTFFVAKNLNISRATRGSSASVSRRGR